MADISLLTRHLQERPSEHIQPVRASQLQLFHRRGPLLPPRRLLLLPSSSQQAQGIHGALERSPTLPPHSPPLFKDSSDRLSRSSDVPWDCYPGELSSLALQNCCLTPGGDRG